MAKMLEHFKLGCHQEYVVCQWHTCKISTYLFVTGRHRSHISSSTIRLSLCRGILDKLYINISLTLLFCVSGTPTCPHTVLTYSRVMHYVITAHVPDLRIGEQSESRVTHYALPCDVIKFEREDADLTLAKRRNGYF